jgi:hypothetical protein
MKGQRLLWLTLLLSARSRPGTITLTLLANSATDRSSTSTIRAAMRLSSSTAWTASNPSRNSPSTMRNCREWRRIARSTWLAPSPISPKQRLNKWPKANTKQPDISKPVPKPTKALPRLSRPSRKICYWWRQKRLQILDWTDRGISTPNPKRNAA